MANTSSLPRDMRHILHALSREWDDLENLLPRLFGRQITAHLNNCVDLKLVESEERDGTLYVRLSDVGLVIRDTVDGFPERPGGRYQE